MPPHTLVLACAVRVGDERLAASEEAEAERREGEERHRAEADAGERAGAEAGDEEGVHQRHEGVGDHRDRDGTREAREFSARAMGPRENGKSTVGGRHDDTAGAGEDGPRFAEVTPMGGAGA